MTQPPTWGAPPPQLPGGWQGQPPSPQAHLAYRLAPDDYRGGQAIQLVVEHRAPA